LASRAIPHQHRHPPLRNLWPFPEVREPIGDALQIHGALEVFAVATLVGDSDSAGHAKGVYVLQRHVVPGLQPAEAPDFLETPSGRFGNLGLRDRSAIATGKQPANKGRELVNAGEVGHEIRIAVRRLISARAFQSDSSTEYMDIAQCSGSSSIAKHQAGSRLCGFDGGLHKLNPEW
jgi:hypothetical protein